MSQTKLQSLIETCCNTAIGYVISFFGQLVIFPAVGIKHVSIRQNIAVGLLFTILSIARGYAIRRFFANLQANIHRFATKVESVLYPRSGTILVVTEGNPENLPARDHE